VVEFFTVPVRVWAEAREVRRRVISARRFPVVVGGSFKFAVLSGFNSHFSRPYGTGSAFRAFPRR
jgi:hypothetical protein